MATIYDYGTGQIHITTESDHIVQAYREEGDAVPRFQVRANGQMEWGSGSAAVDTNLYRSAANVLTTDDALAATGGVRPASGSVYTATRAQFWVNNLVPSYAALGDAADQIPVAGTVYFAALYIPVNYTGTGIGYVIGSVGGTDKAIAALYSSAGVAVAWSALAGTTVGTADTVQQLPFTATYAVVGPGLYYASISLDGTTARLAASAAIGRAGSATGAFATLDDITPPTTNAATIQAYLY